MKCARRLNIGTEKMSLKKIITEKRAKIESIPKMINEMFHFEKTLFF